MKNLENERFIEMILFKIVYELRKTMYELCFYIYDLLGAFQK
jgi:hypothetical protein